MSKIVSIIYSQRYNSIKKKIALGEELTILELNQFREMNIDLSHYELKLSALHYEFKKIMELIAATIARNEDWLKNQTKTQIKRVLPKTILENIPFWPTIETKPGQANPMDKLLDQVKKYEDLPKKLPYPLRYDQ